MQPIPPSAGDVRGWQEIPIVASTEKLVKLNGSEIAVSPIYHTRYHADAAIFVRESVMRRLREVQRSLPDDIELVVLDGYRSLELQQLLFDRYYNEFRDENPDLSPEEIMRKTEQYVRIPSVSEMAPSPHLTAGAVDVSLRYRDGEWLDFGSTHDSMEERSALSYFEKSGNVVNDSDAIARDNRRLLYWAMTGAGFGAYDAEWWHFNAPETQMGAIVAGRKWATFGVASDFS